MSSPRTTTKSSPNSPQLEKVHTQQRRPNAAKNKTDKFIFKNPRRESPGESRQTLVAVIGGLQRFGGTTHRTLSQRQSIKPTHSVTGFSLAERGILKEGMRDLPSVIKNKLFSFPKEKECSGVFQDGSFSPLPVGSTRRFLSSVYYRNLVKLLEFQFSSQCWFPQWFLLLSLCFIAVKENDRRRAPESQLTAEQSSTGRHWNSPKKIPHIQRQRRSRNETVGGAQSQ